MLEDYDMKHGTVLSKIEQHNQNVLSLDSSHNNIDDLL